MTSPSHQKVLVNLEHRTPFVFTTPAPAQPDDYLQGTPSCSVTSADDPSIAHSQPSPAPHDGRTSGRIRDWRLSSFTLSKRDDPRHDNSGSYVRQTPNNLTLLVLPKDTNDQKLGIEISYLNLANGFMKTRPIIEDSRSTPVFTTDPHIRMGTRDAITFKTVPRSPYRHRISDVFGGGEEGEYPQTAVPGVDCDVLDAKVSLSATSFTSSDSFSGRSVGSIESRRKNFSASSLPLSLMASTIEEVDDSTPGDTSPTHKAARSQSYGGSVNRVHTRALRRESRVPSASSPPRAQQSGPTNQLSRSITESTNRAARPENDSLHQVVATSFKDFDIVGESFKSRYPWQRDFGVQCDIAKQRPPCLLRVKSGPALYTYFTGPPNATNSGHASSPQLARDRSLHRRYCRSCSHPDLSCFNPPRSPSERAWPCYSHPSVFPKNNINNMNPATLPRSYRNSGNIDPDPGKASAPHSIHLAGSLSHQLNNVRWVNRRADFRRRPRPNSVGAVDQLRYHHELSRFREIHKLRRERKSDSQLVLSPRSRHKAARMFPEEVSSSSDLESILENPADRLRDLSRETSAASLELEDEVWSSNAVASSLSHSDHICDDVLISPPASSARMWAAFDYDEDLVGSDDSLFGCEEQGLDLQTQTRNGQQSRRPSCGSGTSEADSDGHDRPAIRMGRRSAIYETKNCGDVSPTTLSPEVSPCNSCDEGEGASNIAERLRRRRSSVDLAMNIYPGDLLVQEHHKKLIKRNTIADFYAVRQSGGESTPLPFVGPLTEGLEGIKKGRQSFSLLKLMKTRSKESLSRLEDILRRMKPSEFKDNHLAAYKTLHWSDLIASSDKQMTGHTLSISGTERKRREAVWELFKSECVFLIDHLMVLKHCFMEPLKKVQVEGCLMHAEPQDLFGNLDELCYVSYTFCKDFISALLKDMSVTDFGRTPILLKAFQRFSAHSRDGAVYHAYCLNYTNALAYLEKLRTSPDFAEFEKWCEQDSRCNRLQLTDLLVAPMQHCTKLPLLLLNVRKYTADEEEREQVTESIQKVETSLKQLEEKMRWIKNFERVQEINRQLIWPNVMELDPRCVIPESLKPSLRKQPCEKLLTCPKRLLIHEGQVTLIESPKPLEVHLFLFDDILLIAKVKKTPKKFKQLSLDTSVSAQSEKVSYIVLRQPLALDRFMLHDISPSDAAASGLKHCFTLVHISRYQQITGVFTFQAACETTKATWLTQIREAMDAYARLASCPAAVCAEDLDLKAEQYRAVKSREKMVDYQTRSSPRLNGEDRNSVKSVPTKSRSMDAVFI